MKKEQNKLINLLKIAVICVFCIIAILLVRYVGVDELKAFINHYDTFSPIVYIICFSLMPIFFFPVPILAVVAGAMFGLLEGSIYTIIGAMINSVLMFYIARFFNFKAIRNFVKKYKISNDQIDSLGFILILRLMPLVPYNALNYACGFMQVSIKEYSLATLLGIIPATFVMVNLGDKILDIKSSEFVLACILAILLIFLSSLGAKRIKRVKNGSIDNSSDI
ncbi:VTT domain-containing protein [Campylobacter mucosalis]|uniref:VTT domain-containing protein n=1 Tax=Campylobacter mucosalis TaxID=202 RepID=UPI00146FDE62